MVLDLVNFIYPNMLDNMNNYKLFEERVVLTPTLESEEEEAEVVKTTSMFFKVIASRVFMCFYLVI